MPMLIGVGAFYMYQLFLYCGKWAGQHLGNPSKRRWEILRRRAGATVDPVHSKGKDRSVY